MSVERLARQRPYFVVVLDQEDRLGAPGERGRRRRRRLVNRLVDPREIDLERRSVSGLAIDPDAAAALLDDPEDGRQAQPGPLARVLRGEERLEDPRLDRGVHAVSRVADGE